MHWNPSKLSIYKYPSSGTMLVPSPRRALGRASSASLVRRPCALPTNPLGALFPPHTTLSLHAMRHAMPDANSHRQISSLGSSAEYDK